MKGIKLIGVMTSHLYKKDGSVITRVKPNLITEVGFDFIADALCKSASRPGVLSHIAIGDDNTAADATDTALANELARGAATYSHVAGADSFTLQADFAAGTGTGTLVEAGVLNASSAGVLFDRVVFSALSKEAGDALTQRFEFTMS